MTEGPDRTIGIAALLMAVLFLSAYFFGSIENPEPGEVAFSNWFLPLASVALIAIAVWSFRSRPR